MNKITLNIFSVLLGLLILTFYSCIESGKVKHKTDFGCINFYNPNDRYLKVAKANNLSEAGFYYYYLGESKDSIVLNFSNNYSDSKLNKLYRRHDYYHLKYVDSSDLVIFIDTTRIIGTPNDRYKSFPVFVKNVSKDTLRFRFALEFKAKNGEWVYSGWRDSKKVITGCGSGSSEIVFPPSKILVTSCKVYEGAVETKMRIRSGPNFSNEIFNSIGIEDFEINTDSLKLIKLRRDTAKVKVQIE